MGGGNGLAMPHYLMNTAFNMIEIVDNTTGKTIGNALCYFAIEKENNIIFVIDNIEINNTNKPSADVGIELRKRIFEYASAIARSVTGKDTEVCISGNYNDVELTGLKKEIKTLKILGNVDCSKIYMDLLNGWKHWSEAARVSYYKE
jgi:hypothetical protein